jgi:uncharacterized protein YndB with AHSA1/START domain
MTNAPDHGGTGVHRRGDHELVITRRFAAPPALVFRAWSEADLFRRWWVPASFTGARLVDCAMDARTGGGYRLVYGSDDGAEMAFHGQYLDVLPGQRLVWTNDEDPDGAITTVLFTEAGAGQTLVTYSETYRSAAALEAAMASNAIALPEQLQQLADLLAG